MFCHSGGWLENERTTIEKTRRGRNVTWDLCLSSLFPNEEHLSVFYGNKLARLMRTCYCHRHRNMERSWLVFKIMTLSVAVLRHHPLWSCVIFSTRRKKSLIELWCFCGFSDLAFCSNEALNRIITPSLWFPLDNIIITWIVKCSY